MAAPRKINLKKRNRFIEKYWPSDVTDEVGDFELPFDVAELWKHVPDGEFLDLRRLSRNPGRFADMSPKEIAEVLGKPAADEIDSGAVSVELDDFFDGNNDPASVATNAVGTPRHPGLRLVRDVLDVIRQRPDVVDVRLSIVEIPNPDVPEDNGFWPQADAVYVWTTAGLTQVRRWLQPLQMDGVGRAEPSSVAGPNPSKIGPRVSLYKGVWD